ncbi:MAG TPA: hypothetical protein VHZ55_27805 [Bryobacteraceae bacterium]|nr:hypothetical protein [Bryobacteraceae bacterium]
MNTYPMGFFVQRVFILVFSSSDAENVALGPAKSTDKTLKTLEPPLLNLPWAQGVVCSNHTAPTKPSVAS